MSTKISLYIKRNELENSELSKTNLKFNCFSINNMLAQEYKYNHYVQLLNFYVLWNNYKQ